MSSKIGETSRIETLARERRPAMVHLVITHGRSHAFEIPALTQRPLEEAVRFGLQRIASPHFATIPVSLAFYSDHWRPDARELEFPSIPRLRHRRTCNRRLPVTSFAPLALHLNPPAMRSKASTSPR